MLIDSKSALTMDANRDLILDNEYNEEKHDMTSMQK